MTSQLIFAEMGSKMTFMLKMDYSLKTVLQFTCRSYFLDNFSSKQAIPYKDFLSLSFYSSKGRFTHNWKMRLFILSVLTFQVQGNNFHGLQCNLDGVFSSMGCTTRDFNVSSKQYCLYMFFSWLLIHHYLMIALHFWPILSSKWSFNQIIHSKQESTPTA